MKNIPQRHGQTDGQTDDMQSHTALCVASVVEIIKIGVHLRMLLQSKAGVPLIGVWTILQIYHYHEYKICCIT